MSNSSGIKRVNSVEASIGSPVSAKRQLPKKIIDNEEDNSENEAPLELTGKRRTRSSTKTSKSIQFAKSIDNQTISKLNSKATELAAKKTKKNSKPNKNGLNADTTREAASLDSVREGFTEDLPQNAQDALEMQAVITSGLDEVHNVDLEQDLVADVDEQVRDAKNIIRDLLKQAEDKNFPQKEFFFDDIRGKYTPVLNFFQHETQFSTKPKGRINFKCIVCNEELEARIGRFTNLNRHLNKHNHKDVKKWLELYAKSNSKSQAPKLTPSLLNLVKYFISSNMALSELSNKFLRGALSEAGLVLPSSTSFRDTTLPQIMNMMKDKITHNLQNARFVCLITDNWSNRQMMGFIAVAVNIIDSSYDKETIFIGMKRTNGRQTAENVKLEIESIVNEYDFLKNKIKGTE